MGGGYWQSDIYDTKQTFNKSHGISAFSQYDVHDDLNPKGVKVRESRDSDDHPESLAVALLFDHTGSMATIPQELQENFKQLFGILLRGGVVEHPQILVGSFGDAGLGDAGALQISQFESDNRIDENLSHIWLAGGGGGNMQESYELALYFMARHTVTDCWEKRGDKGVLFITGDELPYDKLRRQTVKEYIGDDLPEDLTIEQIVSELQEKWEVFFLMAQSGSYPGHYDRIFGRWRKLFGERALELRDVAGVSEWIASLIRAIKGDDIDQILDDLKQVGTATSTINDVSTALSTITQGKGALAKASGSLSGLGTVTGKSGTRRL